MYLFNALHFKTGTGTKEHNEWQNPIGGPRIDAKNARCSRWIVFSFFSTFINCDLGGKKVSLFSKEVKMLEV